MQARGQIEDAREIAGGANRRRREKKRSAVLVEPLERPSTPDLRPRPR
jgi:hypothetical protein